MDHGFESSLFDKLDEILAWKMVERRARRRYRPRQFIAQTLQKRQIRAQLTDLTRVAQDEWRDQLARIAQIDRLDLRDREIRDASDLARMGPDLGRGGLGKRAQIEIWNAGGISLPCEDRLLGGAPILSIGKLSSSVRMRARYHCRGNGGARSMRSEEHTSELQSLMRISYAVFCLKKKKKNQQDLTSQQDKSTNNKKQHTHSNDIYKTTHKPIQ